MGPRYRKAKITQVTQVNASFCYQNLKVKKFKMRFVRVSKGDKSADATPGRDVAALLYSALHPHKRPCFKSS